MATQHSNGALATYTFFVQVALYMNTRAVTALAWQHPGTLGPAYELAGLSLLALSGTLGIVMATRQPR